MTAKKTGLVLCCLLMMALAGWPTRSWSESFGEIGEDRGSESIIPKGIYRERAAAHLKLTLQQCVDTALTNNRDIRGKQYDVDVAHWKLEEATRAFYPVLDYEYNLAPAPKNASAAVDSLASGDLTVFNRVRLGLGIPLTTFGKISAAQDLAHENITVNEQDHRKKRQEVVFQIRQIYYGILLGKEMDHLLGAARDRLRQEIEERDAKADDEEAGPVDPQEVLKLKVFRFLVDQKMDELYKKMETGYEALKIQLGLDPNLDIDIADEHLQPVIRTFPELEKVKEEALLHRPEARQLEAGIQAARENYELEMHKLAPDLGFGGFFEMARAPGVSGTGNQNDYTDPFNYTRAGFGFRLQGQFDWKGSHAKIKEAELTWKKADYQKEYAKAGIGLDVSDAYWNVKNNWAQVERTREAQKLSRQLLFLAQSNIDIGLGSGADLVEGIQAFMLARSKYFEAVFDYNVSIAKLDQKTGRDE